MSEYIRYDDSNFLGSHINNAAEQMIAKANETGANYSLKFNGTDLYAHPGDTVDAAVDDWDKRGREAHEAWKLSPEGIEYARKEAIRVAERDAEIARRRQYWIDNPLPDPPFQMSDPDGWAECVAANGEDEHTYGGCGIVFAKRWACMMERDMAAGMTVSETAKLRQFEADVENQMTGFQWGCALSILCQVWKHGDDLRAWREADRKGAA